MSGFNNGALDLAALLLGLAIGMLFVLPVVLLVAWLVYRANEALPREHRKLESWQAFLLAIPIFNLVWAFILTARVSKGFQSFFASKNDPSVDDCGEKIGLWFAICWAGSHVPLLWCLSFPAAIVLLILYLVKITGLRARVLTESMA